MNTFGNVLKQLRLQKGLSQVDFAKIINVAKGTVSNWEKGNRNPDHQMLLKIANFFNVSIDYLLCNTDAIENSVNSKWQPELTKKDEKDIEKSLNKTLEMLENQEGLMLSGEPIDEDDFELIKAAILNGLEYAKKVNKKKYTPKKYRK